MRTEAERFTRIVRQIPPVLEVAHTQAYGVFALGDLAHAAVDAALLAGASAPEVREWAALAAETDVAILRLATQPGPVEVEIHGVRWDLSATGQHPAADWRRWALGWAARGLAGLPDAPLLAISPEGLFPAPAGWNHWASTLAAATLSRPLEPHLGRAIAHLAGDPDAEAPLRFFGAWLAEDPDEASAVLEDRPETPAARLQLAGLTARAAGAGWALEVPGWLGAGL